MGIDKDKLKQLLEEEIPNEDEAKQFRDRMKYNKDNSTTIELDDFMKGIVISILRGEMTAKEASERYHIDRETIRRKINEYIKEDSSLLREYIEYQNKSERDYGNINFKGLIIHIIRSDLSQSEAALELGIPSRTISREIEKLSQSDDSRDIKLYDIAKICADKKMKRIELTPYERELYDKLMDEMFGDVPIIDINVKSKSELEIERLEQFLRQVEEYKSQNMTTEQIATKMGVGVSTIRRNKLKLEELKGKKRIKELEGR